MPENEQVLVSAGGARAILLSSEFVFKKAGAGTALSGTAKIREIWGRVVHV